MKSMKGLSFASAVLMFMSWGTITPARAVTLIDTTPQWDGYNIGYFGEIEPSIGKNISTFGQTFTVGKDNVLNSFSFFLMDTSDAENINIAAYVRAWDGTRNLAIGPVLYQSLPQSLSSVTSCTTTPRGFCFKRFTFETGGITLSSGRQYVAFISVANLVEQPFGSTYVGQLPANPYPNGYLVFLQDRSIDELIGVSIEEITSSRWTRHSSPSSGTDDAAFRASFAAEAAVGSWKRQLGTSRDDSSNGVAADSLGNVYISGYTTGSVAGSNPDGDYDAWIAKYNSAGTLVWKRQLGSSRNDSSNGVATDSLGNVYITGYTTGSLAGSNPDGEPDAWIAKYNSAGILVWKRQWGSSRDDYSHGVATDTLGNVYITGNTNGSLAGSNPNGDYNAWVAKYNSSGTRVWQRQLGTSYYEYPSSVATDRNGNVYISGNYWGVAKYNSSGTLLWKRQFAENWRYYSSNVVSVAPDSNGNYYISGTTSGSTSMLDAVVEKYNSNGALVWRRELGTSSYEGAYAYDVTTDSNSNVYISGRTTERARAGIYDPWVAKYDSSGNLVWKQVLETYSDGSSESRGVATDHNGNVYISGFTDASLAGNNQGGSDAWIAKYSAAER